MIKIKQPKIVSEFSREIIKNAAKFGGWVNYHTHLDRALTDKNKYLAKTGFSVWQAACTPLSFKHGLTAELHKSSAYQDIKDLKKRMRLCLEDAIFTGTRELVTFIDATADIELRAIETAIKLKEKYKSGIKIKIAAHPVFGFRENRDYRKSPWEVFEKACRMNEVDIVGGLPEKDDRKDSIGINGHLEKILKLGKELNKEIHVHVGQANDPRQKDIFNLIKMTGKIFGESKKHNKIPQVWAVHAISPSAYPEEEFKKVLDGLKKYNIGVICCPKAAISMLLPRSVLSPTHNSIARILEMAYRGIPIRIGTDNISDLYIPSSNGSMLDELLMLADSLRFYMSPLILAKFATATPLDQKDKKTIGDFLKIYKEFLQKRNPKFKFCI